MGFLYLKEHLFVNVYLGYPAFTKAFNCDLANHVIGEFPEFFGGKLNTAISPRQGHKNAL
jgi:hypothetical protein